MLKKLDKQNKNIILKPQENWVFFDETFWKFKRTFELDKWSNLQIFGYLDSKTDYDLEIFIKWNEADLCLNFMIIGNESEEMKAKIQTNIFGNFTKVKVNIVSLVKNWWFIDIDGIIDVWKHLKKVEWNLSQSNIFLGSSWKIRWVPSLMIASDDVKVGHSLTAEKISDEQLFYLRSRWISEDDSVKFILNSYFKKTFEWLEKIDNIFYIGLFKRFSTIF